ncbi:unnamed protein product [Cylicocyclus nassatus]|uniref:Uncharacterized protein n=1 Tax=Cylicocyclus nassatus TaxID=53992 RepID=A0AA36DQY9_CYLNA|nr:unnamed protein product [Cylicocyclus nassatus]
MDSLIEMIKENFKSDNVEPLVLTISSSVWHLLDTEQATISKTMSSISIPEISGKISKFQYKVSDAKIEMFSLPSNGISFQKYDHGVYLKIKGVQFRASAKAKVGLVKKSCLLCLPLPSLKGGIIVTSENVSLDVKLAWHDYKFTPKISMESNIKLKFTGSLKPLNIVAKFVDVKALLKDKIENLIDKNIVNKLDKGVNSLGNPHLQQLKTKISSAGYNFLFESPIDWTVRNNNLRIAVKLNGRWKSGAREHDREGAVEPSERWRGHELHPLSPILLNQKV